MKKDLIDRSEAYIDGMFGPGAGKKHSRFIDRIENETLRETLHQYHVIESRTEHLSIEENYLLGMTVLYATRRFGVAGMFARTLLHLGVPREKLLEAVARLTMWVGGISAAEAAGHLHGALRDYEKNGAASMKAWFPEEPSDE